ncbi:MAG: arginine deiminase-related protein [Gammaproteobacteria bacterium]
MSHTHPSTPLVVVRTPSAFEISRPDNAHMAKALTTLIEAAQHRVRTSRCLQQLNLNTDPLLRALNAFADPQDQRTWDQLANDLIQAHCASLNSTQQRHLYALICTDACAQHQQAQQEHAGLVKAYRSAGFTVDHLSEHPGSDAVFVTDTGEQIDTVFLLGKLLHTRRHGEEDATRDLLKRLRIPTLQLPGHTLEGGDLIYSAFHRALFVGEGFRNHTHPAQAIAKHFSALFPTLTVLPVQLTLPEHYHLDCCFNVLSGGEVIAYPDAIAPTSWTNIEHTILRQSATPILTISRREALAFSTNFISIQRHVFLPSNSLSTQHLRQLTHWGYHTHSIPYHTFHLSGGSVRCSTLILYPP